MNRFFIAAAVCFFLYAGLGQSQEITSSVFSSGGGATVAADNVLELTGVIGQTAIAAPSERNGLALTSGFAATLTDNEVSIPLNIQHTPTNAAVLENQRHRVTANVTPATNVTSVQLYYKNGGEQTFQAAEMENLGDDLWQQNIPAVYLNSRGAQYYILATDLNGGVYRSAENYAVSVAVSGVAPVNISSKQYKLFSLPLAIADADPLSIFSDLGEYDNTKWRLWSTELNQDNLNNAQRPFREFLQGQDFALETGKAYWLIVDDSYKIQSGAGQTVSLTEDFSLNLVKGWNFIGSPFDFDTPVSAVRIDSLVSPIWQRVGNNWSQLSSDDVITPYSGYAVKVSAPGKFRILLNNSAMPVGGINSFHTNWVLRLEARINELQDTYNFAGVAADPNPQLKKRNHNEPPVIGDYVSLYFTNKESPNFLSSDIRSSIISEKKIWEFRVISSAEGSVEFSVRGLNDLPDNLKAIILIKTTGDFFDLERNSAIHLNNKKDTAMRMQLIVGLADEVTKFITEQNSTPKTFKLDQNYPNPFNPSTAIRYALPHAARVTLNIYNIRGELVTMLLDNDLQESGYRTAVWNGRDDSGRVVASGVYFYALRAEGKTQVRKMSFVK